ncbi:MAG: 16S rRNA (guanine(966)-N(2))-methyltransferase RsmD [Candidatus Poribacteria bacterium]|nr:16S rRNA (guanine(966)-N(2))-methyltransferase RsmD [Candidatus Poribacteria bacterium]
MRIVAGTLRGRQIRVPKGDAVRPTTDRVKESLFAILRSEVVDARVLDLFAGSGNLGIEAHSRGASHVTFVEQNANHLRTLHDNIKSLSIPKEAVEVLKGDAEQCVLRLAEAGERFEIIFLDPPYASGLGQELLRTIGYGSHLTHASSVVLYEHERQAVVADHYGALTRVRIERYGDTTVSFFRVVKDATPNDPQP